MLLFVWGDCLVIIVAVIANNYCHRYFHYHNYNGNGIMIVGIFVSSLVVIFDVRSELLLTCFHSTSERM